MTEAGTEKVQQKPVLVTRDWLVVVVLLMVVIFMWLGFEIYKVLTKTEIAEPLRSLAKPMTTQFDKDVFEDLASRRWLRESEVREEERVRTKDGVGGGEVEAP